MARVDVRVCTLIVLALIVIADAARAQDLTVSGVAIDIEQESARSSPDDSRAINPELYRQFVGPREDDGPTRVESRAFDPLPQVAPQTAQRPAEPTHTGLKAIAVETWSDFKAFPRRRSTWVILAIAGGAAAAVHPADDSVNAHLAGSDAAGRFFAAGKWIGSVYVQTGVAVGLYVAGRYIVPRAPDAPKTNKVSHLGFDMIRALILSQALTQGIKITVRRDRPTGECCAFPSGHASATFATASVLERHLGYRGSWPAYLIATYVATSRLHDNRHFLSDVVFGAGVGVASGWTVVGRHGRSNYALVPTPIRGGLMLTFTRQPSQAGGN